MLALLIIKQRQLLFFGAQTARDLSFDSFTP